jgi:hypothetical protein
MNTVLLMLLALAATSFLVAILVTLAYIIKSVFWHDGDEAKKERAAARERIDVTWKGSSVLRWARDIALIGAVATPAIYFWLVSRM